MSDGKITGRLRFRYQDGSYLEWSSKEHHTAEEMHALIDKFIALDTYPAEREVTR